MKTLVVFESFFNNTHRIASAIAKGIGSEPEVRVMHIRRLSLEELEDVELLVVGAPTRGFRPGPETWHFLRDLPKLSLRGVMVAAFDTRIDLEEIHSTPLRFLVQTGGFAARAIAEKLRHKGGRLLMPGEGFRVTATEGPLKEGELERAEEWGAKVLEKARQQHFLYSAPEPAY